ncbi:unnamed protein product [Parnassius apollo]|uniref:(apollo) hypothetical protein n=1 Tax=Parnassius apollo TaxID=110799 RepID=A0A8S3Y3R9_PARAO|nr:unnamed protein product [Parnassius apollo]
MQPTTMLPKLSDTTQTISFSEGDGVCSSEVYASDVIVTTNAGSHNHGSSKVKLKNLVDYNWEPKFYPGQLLAVHISGKYLAYSIKAPNPANPGTWNGMVRVVYSPEPGTDRRTLIKGMKGEVQDLAFAHIQNQVVLACIDELGNFYVHEIEPTESGLNVNLVLEVWEDTGVEGTTHRVVWCPYIPDEEDDTPDDDVARLLLTTHGNRACGTCARCARVRARVLGGCAVGAVSALAGRGARTAGEHAAPGLAAAFSPDGTALATAAANGYVMFFQVRTLKRGCEHAAPVQAATFSPDGTALATAAADGYVMFFQVRTLKRGCEHAAPVLAAAFSPDGTALATAAANGYVMFFQVRTLKRGCEHAAPVQAATFSPDGTALATAAADGYVMFFQVRTLKRGCEHAAPVVAATFSPDGTALATVAADGYVMFIQVRTFKRGCEHAAPVLASAFSPDGTALATAAADGYVMFFQVRTLKRGCEHAAPVVAATFSPDGTALAAAAAYGYVMFFQVRTLKRGCEHAAPVQAAIFSPDGTALATAAAYGYVMFFQVRTLKRGCEHAAPVQAAAFSPDGTALATAAADGYVMFFQVYMDNDSNPRCLHKWQPHGGKPLSCLFFLDNHKNYNTDVQFWKFAVTGAENNALIKIWSCKSWNCLQSITFSPAPGAEPAGLGLKAMLDTSANYLLLSDFKSRSLYVLNMARDADDSMAYCKSISEFLLPYPVLSFCIVDAEEEEVKCESSCDDPFHQRNGSSGDVRDSPDAFELNQDDTGECAGGGRRVCVRLYIVQPRGLQEGELAYAPPAPQSRPDPDPMRGLEELTLEDTEEEVSTAAIPSSILQQQSQQLKNLLMRSQTQPGSLISQRAESPPPIPPQLNLMTPDAFSSPGKRDEEDPPLSATPDVANKPRTSTSGQEDVVAVAGEVKPPSGGSSPSREVQQIMSHNDQPYYKDEMEEGESSQTAVIGKQAAVPNGGDSLFATELYVAPEKHSPPAKLTHTSELTTFSNILLSLRASITVVKLFSTVHTTFSN